ncbi:MAG: helix-turn-helix domain-containing protein [Nocardioidaceae bacterium]
MSRKYTELDPRSLKAVAHPVRGTLLYELFARGASTATELAAAIGEPVNSVSFHLRQLAKYGVIEEAPAPERGRDRRQRWWRAASDEGLLIDTAAIGDEPGGIAALDVFERQSVAWWQALVERFFRGRRLSGDEADRAKEEATTQVWQSHDVPMLLTDSEAEQMTTELYDVMRRWSQQGRQAAERSPEERRTYLGLTLVMPHPTDLVDR